MENTEENDKQARLIQNAWRKHSYKKIYKYYRDIIFFKSKGSPSQLLKAINPSEAYLLDAAANVHVRFRLGGENFPPNIYYKIYLSGALCDINSYAPRDYSSINRIENEHTKRLTYKEYQESQKKYGSDGWYMRFDNNGWRPITHKMLQKLDAIEIFSANKIKYFHHKKNKREIKKAQKIRINKVKWFENLYKQSRLRKSESESIPFMFDSEDGINPFKQEKYLDLENEKLDEEAKELIEWSENLDYEKYIANWLVLSTSNMSNNYSQTFQEIEPIKSRFQ